MGAAPSHSVSPSLYLFPSLVLSLLFSFPFLSHFPCLALLAVHSLLISVPFSFLFPSPFPSHFPISFALPFPQQVPERLMGFASPIENVFLVSYPALEQPVVSRTKRTIFGYSCSCEQTLQAGSGSQRQGFGHWTMAGLCPVFPEASNTIRSTDPIPAPFLEVTDLLWRWQRDPFSCDPVGLHSRLGNVRAWGFLWEQGEAKGTVSFTHQRCHGSGATGGIQAASRGQPRADVRLEVWRLRLEGIHCLGKRQVPGLTISQNPSMWPLRLQRFSTAHLLRPPPTCAEGSACIMQQVLPPSALGAFPTLFRKEWFVRKGSTPQEQQGSAVWAVDALRGSESRCKA